MPGLPPEGLIVHRTRIALTVVLVLVCTPLIYAGSPVRTEVLSDSGDGIVVRFEIGEFDSRTVVIDGVEHQEIELVSEPVFLEKGQPALPHVNRSVIIPDDVHVTVRVVASAFTETQARIAPSKGNLLRTVDPNDVPYEFSEAYRSDTFFPGTLAELGKPYI